MAGNVFAVSAGVLFDTKPALWVLPFNATTGAYGAPILIDNSCGIVTEVLVAGTAATPIGAAAPAWNVGDVLVLVNDILNPRVLVYSQAAIAGVMSNPGKPLSGPTGVAISPSSLRGTLPIGMDLWPADATHGVSLLLTTVGGRVLRFDSGSNALSTDFANGLGFGLQRIKVGTYSTVTYAFVAQYTPGSGRILQFSAPPVSGSNAPLAALSTGNNDPQGLAVTSSGSVPVSACIAPSICDPAGSAIDDADFGIGNRQHSSGGAAARGELHRQCGSPGHGLRQQLDAAPAGISMSRISARVSQHGPARLAVRTLRALGCGIRGGQGHREDGGPERQQYLYSEHHRSQCTAATDLLI